MEERILNLSSGKEDNLGLTLEEIRQMYKDGKLDCTESRVPLEERIKHMEEFWFKTHGHQVQEQVPPHQE